MDSLTITIFSIAFYLLWIVFSVYCGIFFLKTQKNKAGGMHWSMKVFFYYGFSFWCLLVAGVILSFAISLGMMINKGF